MSVVSNFVFGDIVVPWMPDELTDEEKETINICDPFAFGMILYYRNSMIYILNSNGEITWFSHDPHHQKEYLFQNVWDCFVANYYKKIEY